MYIAVLDEVPDFITPTLVAHAVLGAHLFFQEKLFYNLWLNNSFKKVVVRVNANEFQKISNLENVYLAHENKTLEGQDSCVVVCPRIDIPNVLKFSKLWKPKDDGHRYSLCSRIF